MKKYAVEVRWYHTIFDYTTIEVEADSPEAAEELALERAQQAGPDDLWNEGGDVVDGWYQMEDTRELT